MIQSARTEDEMEENSEKEDGEEDNGKREEGGIEGQEWGRIRKEYEEEDGGTVVRMEQRRRIEKGRII